MPRRLCLLYDIQVLTYGPLPFRLSPGLVIDHDFWGASINENAMRGLSHDLYSGREVWGGRVSIEVEAENEYIEKIWESQIGDDSTRDLFWKADPELLQIMKDHSIVIFDGNLTVRSVDSVREYQGDWPRTEPQDFHQLPPTCSTLLITKYIVYFQGLEVFSEVGIPQTLQ
ncbi:hypothetical protein FRB96_003419 [Tulasnella sp. 330]|nr:hypothetical protein FRB96_003419 [Tulasnella sp. 330]KAG8876791.1 hypothetical protein FRB98_007032 [Tulasnella sp. 332]KAG8882747.1 hypothetical protein FRB97_007786 [Tulasnella sp. 331]